MEIYGNFVRGNSSEVTGTLFVGTNENLWEFRAWELMGTYGNFMHVFALQGVFSLCFSAARRFFVACFRCRSFSCCVFHDASRFFTVCFCCQSFLHCMFSLSVVFHCVFSLSVVFTLCVFAVDHVYIVCFRCKAFFVVYFVLQ